MKYDSGSPSGASDRLGGTRSTMSRRMLLRHAAVAASPLAVHQLPQLQAGIPRLQDPSCSLGFSTYGMQKMVTEDALALLAGIGFDAVELTVRDGWDADAASLAGPRRKEIRKRLADSGLRLTSLMEHVFPRNGLPQTEALERLRLATELAHDLAPDSPPLIQTVLGGGRFEDVKHELLGNLQDWAELASESDSLIAIKPHRGGAVSTPAEGVWLINQLGTPPQIKLVYDYSHYAFRQLPLEQTIDTAFPYTAHIAVKDAVQQADKVAFELPGAAGTVDYITLLRRFYDKGYRGDVNCEVSGMVSSQPGYDPEQAARFCYKAMAEAFQKAGVPRVAK